MSEADKDWNLILHRAVALDNQGRYAEAMAGYEILAKQFPKQSVIQNYYGSLLLRMGRNEQALKAFKKSLDIDKNQPDIHYMQGIAYLGTGLLGKALSGFDAAIRLKPDFEDAYLNKGVALHRMKQYDNAILCYEKALKIDPNLEEAHFNKAVSLHELKQYSQALENYDFAIVIKPDYAEAYYNKGNTLHELERYQDAVVSYDKAIEIDRTYLDAYFNKAKSLKCLDCYDDALKIYDQLLQLKPDDEEAYFNRGNVLQLLNRFEDAVASYDKVIEFNAGYVDAYLSRGEALHKLNQLEAALASFEAAIAVNKKCAEAYLNRGYIFRDMDRAEEAIASFERAIAINPKQDFALGTLLHSKMLASSWGGYTENLAKLVRLIDNGEKVITPFVLLSLIDDPERQHKVGKLFSEFLTGQYRESPRLSKYTQHEKIRLGYFSADFHVHATMHLLAETFGFHDRSKFELVAFSFGPERTEDWQKISKLFDAFHDVRFLPDRDVAKLARELEIDIAVDLKGFTKDCRPGIFAERAAPIQINYLGYPGTMSADYIDYIIADHCLIPEGSEAFYSEKIIYLPNSYQANCAVRDISTDTVRRQDFGLPENGLVFCSFNNNYKITPEVFDSWSRILCAVEGSVLWLWVGNESAKANLRKEAAKRGIDDARIIFADRMPVDQHLNRMRLADLMLDSFPCNAHTTASDALRMGLPLLTLMGQSFAGRVGASLLTSIGLPELITTTLDEYQSLAIQLATHREQLLAIRQRLQANVLTSPLFDSQRYTRDLESAYQLVYDQYHEA